MARDISQSANDTWAARTIDGMVFFTAEPNHINTLTGADLVILHGAAGERVPARVFGPASGAQPDTRAWRIEGRLRIDPGGVPLSSLISDMMPIDRPAHGHEWGALGLSDGLATRVIPDGTPPTMDEAELARASSGHRFGEANWLLTLSPGDRVSLGGAWGTVIALDRRKRTVDVQIDGRATVASLDDVRPKA
jgi:hypothetical protein